jgi:DNA-binding winged helix-turn-helix (wHTH) protein
MSQPSPGPSPQRRFGPFIFDEATGELRKHGIRVRLQGQPLQILAEVLTQPGHSVTREEMQQHLWRGSTFVDFEHGLNSAMNRLRQVLGDSAEQPRYIETVPGRGYRFIAPVQESETKPVLVIPPPVAEQAVVAGVAGKPWRLWIVAAGLVTALAVVFLVASRPRVSAGAPPLRFSISPPDGYALEAGSSRQTFALSPDGTHLAFTAMDASGRFQMFMRDLNALESRPLPNSVGAYHVFWAPDGGPCSSR